MTQPNSLEHHGVLGMKWGIRRYQPYPKGKHGTFLGQTRDDDLIIKKGTEAYRLQEGNKLRPGQSYISLDKVDHMKYIAITAADENGALGVDLRNTDAKGRLKSDARSVRMKLNRDIIAPSYQATMDAFVETMGKVKINDIKPDPQCWEQEYVNTFLKNVKKTKIDKCRDDAYLYFTSTFMEDTKAKKVFFDILKSKGYTAIIDENDARFGEDGSLKTPLILFDSSAVDVTSTKKLSKEDADMFSDAYFIGGLNAFAKHLKAKKRWEQWSGVKLEDEFI